MKNLSYQLVIIFQFLLLKYSQSANILYYLGMSSYSQRNPITPYLEALASRGHNVTFFTPHVPRSNRSSLIKEFSPQFLQDYVLSFTENLNIIEMRKQNLHHTIWLGLGDASVEYCHMLLKDTEINTWIVQSHFDLVIVDSLFCECAIGLAYKFKAPFIVFETFPTGMWQHDVYGIVPETSWVPDVQYGDSPPLNPTLIQKTKNTLRILYWHFYRRFMHYPKMESMLRQYLNMSDMPPLDELTRKPNLVLINNHYSVNYPNSVPPLCVTIGGIHTIDSKIQPLPKKIEEFINNCEKNDLVYMSYGSIAQIQLMSDDLQSIFAKTFSKFQNICFLVKWEGEAWLNVTSNVFTSKWMPQSEILAHPRIRAFITHAGLNGIQEAVYHGVPMIAFPLFAEQDYNAEKIHRVGYGIRLEITTLIQSELDFALKEILENFKYREKMNQVSNLFRDRPDKPIETAVWWTEFVLRKNYSSHFLIPLGAQQTWYERRLLDVWAFVFVIILVASLLIASILLICLKFLLKVMKNMENKIKIN